MKARIAWLALALLPGAAGAAQAQINQRQHEQHRRILQGMRSGELTSREFRRLRMEQAHIRRQEMRARRDGDFSARERVRIQRELNRASRSIYKEKHDGQDRD
jgi:hypothetical protein